MVELVWFNKTKKQQKEMLEAFEKWSAEKDVVLSNWLESVRAKSGKKYDFTADSLIDLEYYIASRFAKSLEIGDWDSQDDINGICTYMGEVFLREIPGKAKWNVPNGSWKGAPDYYRFFWYIYNSAERSNGFSPFGALPFIIKNKTTTRLYDTLKAICEEVATEKSSLAKPKPKPIPGRGGSSHPHFVFTTNSELTLAKIAELMRTYYSSKGRDKVDISFFNDNYLLIGVQKDWYMHVELNTAKWVAEENKEFAENLNCDSERKNVVKNSAIRFEIKGDDDPNFDMMNEPLFLLDQLVKVENVVAAAADTAVTYPE